jgi:CRP/FNR family transcriptional regulator, cyclic AMP receptor protein
LICREGESSAEMFVIRRGSVRVFKASPRGELDLAVLSKGDFFGEMSVLEGLPRDASAQALGEAEVLVMTAGALLVRLRRDPTFAFELLRRLSGRVRSLNARLVHAIGNGGDASATSYTEALLYQSEGASSKAKPREGAA